MPEPTICIALPVLNEMDHLPGLIQALSEQTIQDYKLFVCVNQPEEFRKDESKRDICKNNLIALKFLESLHDKRIKIIDRSSEGSGWHGKNHGIGWARKVLLDQIALGAKPEDIIVSLDADTLFNPSYLESLLTNRLNVPKAVAISVPYYHRLTGDTILDRAMLRYEVYMRAYAINLWRIRSPYSFTALGSAIALPVGAYRTMGGITPKLSGEDFYFLQKLVKTGTVVHWNAEKVYPAARFSDRVYFGTGPALIKGAGGDWESYPVYKMGWFDDIHKTCLCFHDLYTMDVSTPLDDFLVSVFRELPWPALRANFKSAAHFVRACHEKIDGLRLLQYLKTRHKTEGADDESNLVELISSFSSTGHGLRDINLEGLSFSDSPLEQLDAIRNGLENIELRFRKEHYDQLLD